MGQCLTLQIVPPSARAMCAPIAARLRMRRFGNKRRAHDRILRPIRQKLQAGFVHQECVPIWVNTLCYALCCATFASYTRQLRRDCECVDTEISAARMVEYCVPPAKNLKRVFYTSSAHRIGSIPYVTDCPAHRWHQIRADCGSIANAAVRE